MRNRREISIRTASRKSPSSSFSPALFVFLVLAFAVFGLFSFFVKEAYNETKASFIEKLGEEKKVAEINTHLKIELLAITQKGYVEFAAGERLGLKKPKDEEVLVLR